MDQETGPASLGRLPLPVGTITPPALIGPAPSLRNEHMAHSKSQQKRNRQTAVRSARNRAIRSELKTRAKNAKEAARSGDATATAEALRIAQKRIDQALAKGVLKKNTASRRKSNLARTVSAIAQDS